MAGPTAYTVAMRNVSGSLFCLLLLLGCKEDTASKPAKTKAVVDLNPVVIEAPPASTKTHSNGMERFKDPGVYVDGTPIGVLRFGELPTPLAPFWFEERAAVPFKAGDPGPRFKLVKQRRYRFKDYFKAMGVNVAKVKEMHLYGGNQRAAAVVISGDQLRSSDDFLFRFGGSIWGKPIPACPAGVGDGKCPDQVGTVVLYVKKDPPIRKGGYFYFGDKRIEGIPYFGEPIRGGVRVYLDGPLAATVKRNRLKASGLAPVDAENNTYSLFAFLKSQGVDTDVVKAARLVAYDRDVATLSREELLGVNFRAGEAGSGEILIGEDEIATHAILLHSNPINPKDLPVLLPEELEKSDG